MTRIILAVLFLSILAFSCKKKKSYEEPKDEFIYHDFTPDIYIQSVRYFYNYYTACNNIVPVPGDSSTSYKLDLNGDSVADFEFGASHSPYSKPEYCGHCPSPNYYIGIKPLSSKNFVAYFRTSYYPPTLFKESDIMDIKDNWTTSMALRIQQCPSFNWDFSDGYIGIKIGNSLGYIHVKRLPNNGVQILDYGLNNTPSRPIACGQK